VLACQSGQGALSLGQGVYGLRRAFLQAGAETVVSTLWSVEEESATELMKRYTHKLVSQPNKGRVETMEEAMKELREQERYRHPYYWVPFVVMGMDGPLRPPLAAARR
jgi:CHAT domain-containing protein